METLLNFLVHSIVIFGVLAFLGVGIGLATNLPGEGADRGREAALRVISIVAGFLIYYASRAIGISIPELMLNASSSRDVVAVTLISFIGPIIAGLFVTNICINRIEDDSAIAGRITLLIMVLTLLIFVESYVASYKIDSEGINIHLLPNVVFVLTVLLYLIFYFKPAGANK
ncbi:MAG TPA: hypothetical protein VJ001_14215 [Rhodocyclaceae bacterium]|nr:hypothetical protein [Rhodocyclaceae bacterium]